ncbi:hypothetical protein SARC_01055 [Sphaeroforma arctica JP610]|uniref:Thioredoxin domain-containing protein n=1 Tax=Sphaeroforma arctica JP610 TaxID=667725 RepID=A0A0L0GEV9_9EUKA|nr:hypothetical protein SARC_01055 [Sphaeroforma arctica JP610]KNC86823.1 hypothetical protein SARC_01055 [Sphaeroforma arctica JP610]|eukprot:XP_014160725.1 hypothetical protein SARC_01055 [Sphaeroforma arctica JP610]
MGIYRPRALLLLVLLGLASLIQATEPIIAVDKTNKDQAAELVDTDVKELDGVLYLGATQLEGTLKSTSFVVCLYYGLWDSRSMDFRPHFQKLAEKVKEEEGDSDGLQFVAVDATTSPELRLDRHAETFPLIRAYLDEKVVAEFKDKYTIENFAMFIEDLRQKKSKNELRSIGPERSLRTISQDPVGQVIPYFKDTYFTELKRQPYTVILFGSRQCPRTNAMVYAYQMAAKKAGTKNVQFATVDALYEANLRARNHISAYPTILIYRNGKNLGSYQGKHGVDDMVKYVNEFVKTHPVEEKRKFEAKKQSRTVWTDEELYLMGAIGVLAVLAVISVLGVRMLLASAPDQKPTSKAHGKGAPASKAAAPKKDTDKKDD